MDCPLYVVGTAPGATEEATGLPFTGKAGQMVKDVLEAFGVEVYFTNIVKRRPVTDTGVNRKPTKRECWKCGSHLMEELAKGKPKALLVLGQLPMEFFTGQRHRISVIHGLPLMVRKFATDIRVIPTYDPSYVLRKGGLNSLTGDEWLSDIEDAVRVL